MSVASMKVGRAGGRALGGVLEEKNGSTCFAMREGGHCEVVLEAEELDSNLFCKGRAGFREVLEAKKNGSTLFAMREGGHWKGGLEATEYGSTHFYMS